MTLACGVKTSVTQLTPACAPASELPARLGLRAGWPSLESAAAGQVYTAVMATQGIANCGAARAQWGAHEAIAG